jgi:hypothetical protein
VRTEAERLLETANDAIHRLLNAPATLPEDQVQRGFDQWEFEATGTLERLRRAGLCNAWHVDYFRVLNRFDPVNGSRLRGQISEKAFRLKHIAAQLEDRADRLWPL